MLAAALPEKPIFERSMDFLRSGFEDPITVFICGLSLLILFFWYFATEIERRKRNIGSALIIGITALCVLAATPFHEKLKGGIDIIGGSLFSLNIQPREDDTGTKIPVTKEQAEKAMAIIEKRLNGMGLAEPLIALQGNNGVLVQMPGAKPEEGEKIRETLEKVAKLELHKVSERSEMPGPDGTSTIAQMVWEKKLIEVGMKAFMMRDKDQDGKETSRPILLHRAAALGGKDIAAAHPSMMQADAVSITLTSGGTDKMIALTKDMVPQRDRIAIVLDGEVISAPVVNQVPLGKDFIIEGLSEPGEPLALANSLMNPLENPLQIAEMRNVSPTLGASVVKQALIAGGLSLLFTFLFVLLYYRFSGFIAIIGLIINTIILFGVMAMFGATFSLPGIAGMILTIGMAVDANVLIYERLREEIAAGKSVKNAIEASYDKAFSAIFDSNLTSLITAVILFFMGSGAIKGFAITLTIGLLASMFSAILVTRVLFRWGVHFGLIKKLSFLNLIKSTNFDFMGKSRIAIIAAGVTLLIALAAIIMKGKDALGVDFTGGTLTSIQLPAGKPITLNDVNKAKQGLPLSREAYAQIEKSPATDTSVLTIRSATEDAEKITDRLRAELPGLSDKNADGTYAVEASVEEVSGIIGASFLRESLIAIILGLLGIVIYMTVRFEFAFALGGFVAIFHDIIICIGIVILLGDEITIMHVGAVLTIAGYSINDTIIVFDRIRETLLIRSGSVEKIMNDAVNATLSRTLLTSTATIISVVLLWALCGSSLASFGMIILIGIVVGTFSSIFVASPVVLWWSGRRKGRDLRADVLATQEAQRSAAAAP